MQQHATRDLPPELDLPLASGAPWWYWLGGRPALDLVNTKRERWNRGVETLVTPDDLARWLAAAGIVERAPAGVRRSELLEARALREAIDALTAACVGGAPAPATAVALVDRWVARAGTRHALLRGPDGVPRLAERGPADSPRRALGEIALDAARMLGTPEQRARVRVCGAEDCSARFYDRSPAGRRRWCSMESCGNVAKARRHRARRQDASRERGGP
jgi:predicted RNA-binding Zn ribbon-like protein